VSTIANGVLMTIQWSPLKRVCVATTLLVTMGFVVLATFASPALATPSKPPRSPSSGPVASPMLGEAGREYTTMVATRYQHHNQESEIDHSYFYDCVGFVSYSMRRAAPTAWATTQDTLKIRAGFVPSPGRYVSLFDKLDAGTNLAGWAPVTSVAALQPGDVVAWSYDRRAATKPGSASGHAVVIAATPTRSGPDAYSVLVYDSTGTPHGPDDTRRTNPANEPDPGGRPSGLGEGTIGLVAAPDGHIAAVQWSAGGRAVSAAHYGMARPVS
jgi:hypothetical protein